MSATSAPYGLRPVVDVGGSVRGANRQYRLTANTANPFYKGCLVNIAAGVVTPIVATPTTTLGANTPWGVFVGVNYSNAAGPQYQPYLAGGGYTAYNGYGPILIEVVVDPDVIMQVQASGSLALTALGKNAPLANFTGSASTGNSAMQVGAAATTDTLAVKIIELAPIQNNAWGDAYTDVYVRFNQNVHAWRNIAGQ